MRGLIMTLGLLSLPGAALGAGADTDSFEACFDQVDRNDKSPTDNDCLKRAVDAAEARHDPAFALRLAKMVRHRQNSYVAMPLVRLAVTTAAAVNCNDDDVRTAVVAALGLPPDDPRCVDAERLAFGLCWAALKADVTKAFKDEAPSSYYVSNTCKQLLAKGAVAKQDSPKCAAR